MMQILIVLGSLGVFLFGMRMMSEGLQQAAGEGLQKILAYMTSNRFAGVASGFLITTVIQSSSATTVMVVGFVDAALLTLRQAIGVIMGANIGTTVTAWIVALLGFKFGITSAALPAIAVGTAMLLVKKTQRDDLAHALIGFGFLFLGLSLLKDSVPDIRNNPEILQFLAGYTDLGYLSFLLFVIVGTVLTIIVQSSSAAMAIVFQPALGIVDAIVPGSIASRTEIAAHLAMFHTLFNVLNTAIFIGFVPLFEKLVYRLVPEEERLDAGSYRLPYVRAGFQETVELNILTARGELGRMAERVEELFSRFVELFRNPKKSAPDQRQGKEEVMALVVKMQEEITGYVVECSRENISENTATNLNSLVRVAAHLESIADTAGKLIRLAERRAEKGMKLDDSLTGEIEGYSELVSEFLSFNKRHLLSRLSEEEYERAEKMERKLNNRQKKYKKAAQKRLRTGSSVKAELFYLDLLRHLEHLGDYSLEISQALLTTK